jgi:tRNA G10  N-methylase Trm11
VFAGRHAGGERLRVVDPLAGGGTTLFVALAAGHDAFGLERDRRDVETTAAFVRQFCRESRIPHRELRGAKGERRFTFELGPRDDPRTLVLAEGDACAADEELRTVPGGARFHALATDLPYGIQHRTDPVALLAGALPAWERMLLPGGGLAVSWDATRIPRDRVVACVRDGCGLTVRDEPPYDALAHRVDRVVKQRDVVVATKT